MLLSALNPVIGVVTYCALLPVYLVMFVMAYVTIQKNLVVLKLEKFFGCTQRSKLGLISRKHRVTDVVQVSTEEEIDFQSNRSLAYVYRMCFWTPRELAKTVQRKQTIDLISDKQLAYVLLSTVFAYTISWDEERQMYRFMMEGLDEYYLFEGFYWDARQILFKADGSKIIFVMDDRKEYASDAIDSLGKANYNLAKVHAQICLSYFAPGLAHNHVHFVFPSAMCILSKQLLHHKGTLYRLLSPHFRFTERINYQALRVGKATNNKRSSLDRYFFLWQSFPITKEQFTEEVAHKCKQHYVDDVRKCNEEKKRKVGNGSVTSNGDASKQLASHDCSSNSNASEKEQICHYLFPPSYITDPNLQFPYLMFLREYYLVVKRFVRDMEPFIDRNEWTVLVDAVKEHVPFFDKADMVDAIASFIHQVAVIHFCDHHGYLNLFARCYGNMAIRTPFESFANEKHWEEASRKHNFDVNAVRRNPLLLIRQRDVMRSRCFFNLFVDYIPNPNCNLQLIDTEYEFENPGAKQAAANFKSRLRVLDNELENTEYPFKIELGNERDIRAKGLQLVKLNDIIRTVCY